MDDHRTHLLTQVAQMYYEQSATQEAIAAALKLSRPTVSRLLKEAREEGVVQITINSPFRYAAELEADLCRAFPHLRHVRILRTADAGVVARAAAVFLTSIVRDGDIIGVSWGNTLEALTQSLPNRSLKNATVVQLNGGVARAGAGTNAHEVVDRLGRAFGAEMYHLQVPAVVDSPHVREVLTGNRETARVLDLGRRAGVAVYGIGAPEPDSVLVQAGYVTPEALAGLRRQGAAGDICSRYFTVDGRICDPDLDARTIGISLADLARRDYAVAVVSGVHKAPGLLGALRGRLMNVAIVDEPIAREALRLHEGGQVAHD